MVWAVIEQPTAEPVTTDEVKLWLRLPTTYTVDDALIGSLITAARQYIERAINRALPAQRWRFDFDCFATRMVLAGNIREIETFKYYLNGELEDFADYSARLTEPCVITINQSDIPTVDTRADAVQIVAKVGYTTAPQDLLFAMRGIIAHWYENRQAGTPIDIKEVPIFVNAILSVYADRGLI